MTLFKLLVELCNVNCSPADKIGLFDICSFLFKIGTRFTFAVTELQCVSLIIWSMIAINCPWVSSG